MNTGLRPLAVLAATVALVAGTPARACGPAFPDPVFWFTDRPNVAFERFLDGDLGIVDASMNSVDRFVAYRWISGLGLDAASRAALAKPPASITSADDPNALDAVQRWVRARKRIADPPDDDSFSFSRYVTNRSGGDTIEFYYVNCLDDAFDTAVRALDERSNAAGGDAPAVIAWAKAQDRVFHNCDGRIDIPDALGDDSTAAERADRDYQIAAANFYAAQFGEAEKGFRAIAADGSSPWRDVAQLMIARTLIRRGVLSLPVDDDSLRAAEAQLALVVAEPQLSSLHASAARLRDYVALQLDPAAQRQRLAEVLRQPTLGPNARQQLSDYLRLSGLSHERTDGMAIWLRGYPCEACSGVTPLLEEVASVCRSDGMSSKGPPSSEAGPARLTLLYFWARHLALSASSADQEQARVLLDQILAGSEGGALALGDRNRVLDTRAQVATSVEEYLRLSQLVPVGEQVDAGPYPIDVEKQSTLLAEPTWQTIAAYLSPSWLVRALSTRELTPPLARRLAVFAWMRANLAGEQDAADAMVPYLRELAPEMAGDLDAYRSAKGEARRFAFALASLRFPGAQPFPGWVLGRIAPDGTPIAIEEIDSFGSNWWCDAGGTMGESVRPPAFLSSEDAASGLAVRDRLAAVGPAPQYLGAIVFDWARKHPDDARVPEALHRVVRATRYTHCDTGDAGETSRRAFRLLHQRYPNSLWTAQTPFWFGN